METFTKTKIFKNLTFMVFLGGTFLLPLIFVPPFPSAFDLPKWAILVVIVLAGLLFWALEMITSKRAVIKIGPLAKPLAALAVVFIASTLINSSNKIAPFWGSTGLILALTFFYLIGTTMIGKKVKNLFWALVASSFLLSWIAIFSYLELLPKLLPNLTFTASKFFTPAGGPLSLISFLVVLLPITVILGIKKRESLIKVLLFVISAVQAVALILTISLILPGQLGTTPLILLPYAAGWSIAVDQFKTARTALLGIGPGDFISAFSRFRPVQLNMTDAWNVRFGTSSNQIFMILTTVGLLGLAALAWLYRAVIRLLSREKALSLNIGLGLGLILILIMFLLIPANPILLFTFIVLGLALGAGWEETSFSFKHPLIPTILGGIFLLLVVFGGYLTRQVLAAEQAYGASLQAIRENNGSAAYNLLLKAQRRNPFDIRYRLDYANINLALANNLASQKDLTEQERQTILQLVSQSVNEGKNAVALAPQNAAAWENLANIYRQLFNFAQGAEQWAISAYVEAVRRDPTNPRLRVNLGGALYTLRNYDAAIDQFKRAIDLKSDYANAFFNLSWAYRQKNDIVQAYNAMRNTLNLVDRDTIDFDNATTELQKLWELLPEEFKTATAAGQRQPGQLDTPQPYPSPRPAGQLPINNQQQRQDMAPQVPPTEEGESEEPFPKPEEILPPSPSPEL